MKKFYLCKLCLIVFGALLAVQSSPIAFAGKSKFYCEVTDSIVLEVKDGKPIRYSGFTDSILIGEKISIVIDYLDTPEQLKKNGSPLLWIGLNDLKQNDASINQYLPMSEATFKDRRFEVGKYRDYSKSASNYKLIFDSNLRFSSQFSHLDLNRYYKDDWGGVFYGTSLDANPNSFVFSLDCMGAGTVIDKLQEWILEYFKDS